MSEEEKKKEEQPAAAETKAEAASEGPAAPVGGSAEPQGQQEKPAAAGPSGAPEAAGGGPAQAAAEEGGAKAGEAAPGAAEAPAEGEAPVRQPLTDEEKAARRKAALEAREAAKAAGGGAPAARPPRPEPGAAAATAAEPPPPPPPSPNQPRLDRAVQLLRELVAEDAVEEASINVPNGHLPTIVIRGEHWPACAELFRSHPELNIDYLRNVSGVDHETHMEVVYHLLSLSSGHVYAVKVRTDRERPSVPSATPIWETANWPEREIYDLLGIDFPGHPDLRRIMMPDDWVGHPLRKDYVPLDPEV